VVRGAEENPNSSGECTGKFPQPAPTGLPPAAPFVIRLDAARRPRDGRDDGAIVVHGAFGVQTCLDEARSPAAFCHVSSDIRNSPGPDM
jgi:hypothetical protein